MSDEQPAFLDRPIGILARGYVYRHCNARVIGIANGRRIIGVALARDLDEEPACYDLQQFMIDRYFQNRGLGTEALKAILESLRQEGKYNCVEVCVSRADGAAIPVYYKTGFVDTGYIDDAASDCLNLMYRFE